MNEKFLQDVQAAAEASEIAYQQADFPTKLKMGSSPKRVGNQNARNGSFDGVAA